MDVIVYHSLFKCTVECGSLQSGHLARTRDV